MSVEVKVTGNLLGSPESRMVNTKEGRRKITEFRVMSNGYRRNEAGELEQDDTKSQAFDVTVWNERLAENVLRLLQTGARVQVTGNQNTQRWNDKDTGEPRFSLQIDAQTVTLSLTRVENITYAAKRQKGDDQSPNQGQ